MCCNNSIQQPPSVDPLASCLSTCGLGGQFWCSQFAHARCNVNVRGSTRLLSLLVFSHWLWKLCETEKETSMQNDQREECQSVGCVSLPATSSPTRIDFMTRSRGPDDRPASNHPTSRYLLTDTNLPRRSTLSPQCRCSRGSSVCEI